MPPMDRILADLDVQHLQSRGLVGPLGADGTRRVHKRRLNRSSDEENSAIPLNISLQSPEAPTAFTPIPDLLISRASLVYVGFSELKADALWNEWTNWPPTGPRRETDADVGGLVMTFIFFITGTFNGSNDTWEDNDQQWRASLDAFGMATDVQTAIMDPFFKDIRLTQSCAFWAKDTVEMRYAGLKDIQRASREREWSLQRQFGRPGSSSDSAGPSSQGGTRHSQHERQRSISGLQRDATPGISTAGVTPTHIIAARNAPGYTVLYKGLDQARIHGLLDDTGGLRSIGTLLSDAPSDFAWSRGLFYFTPNYEIAQYYAAYAKRRSNCEAVVIVRALVPNSAIEQLNETELVRVYFPNPEWKELVFLSRTREPHPSRLRKYSLATLIIGTIARKPNNAYYRMNNWQDVDESCVLQLRSSSGQVSNSVQFAFSSSDEGVAFLRENCADGISVLPYTRQEFEEWMVLGDE
ncbi:hypothetical protein ACHAQH_007300 [Verticillium albo-atrum]